MKKILQPTAIIFLILLLPAHPGAEQKEGPSGVIKKFNDTLLECMKRGQELGYQGRYKLLEPVVKDTFALSFLAAQSAGGAWKTFSPGQKDLYLKTYTDWTIATYAGRFNSYSGEKFQLGPESKPAQGTAGVTSYIIKSNGEKVEFLYLVRQMEGKWRVVDIRMSGVSQLALTRSQFTSVLKSKGFDGLISMLKTRTKEFSEGKER